MVASNWPSLVNKMLVFVSSLHTCVRIWNLNSSFCRPRACVSVSLNYPGLGWRIFEKERTLLQFFAWQGYIAFFLCKLIQVILLS
jgi:hypothetical protein